MSPRTKTAVSSVMAIFSGVFCVATPAEGFITYWVVLTALYSIDRSPRD